MSGSIARSQSSYNSFASRIQQDVILDVQNPLTSSCSVASFAFFDDKAHQATISDLDDNVGNNTPLSEDPFKIGASSTPVLWKTQNSVLGIIFLILDGIRDIFLCGIRYIMLDIEKYEFSVLGIKYLILLGIISLIPNFFSCYYQAFTFKKALIGIDFLQESANVEQGAPGIIIVQSVNIV